MQKHITHTCKYGSVWRPIFPAFIGGKGPSRASMFKTNSTTSSVTMVLKPYQICIKIREDTKNEVFHKIEDIAIGNSFIGAVSKHTPLFHAL